MMELLLRNGAPIEAKSKQQNTPLHLAILRGQTGLVELLLGEGASLRACSMNNNTPLHLAARCGYTGITSYFSIKVR